MRREDMLARARDRRAPWDLLIIGGGATGVGTAVDAASRGYDVLLLERHDFGQGTSSRSTKLAHGGVRYLRQGNIALVREALHERGRMRRNAPHLVHALGFVVPCYEWWEAPFYGAGLGTYHLLAGRLGLGPTRWLSAAETQRLVPTIQTSGLRGGVLYYDGQFDDARLLIDLVKTAAGHGAVLLNHAPVTALQRDSTGRVTGAVACDRETGEEWDVPARVVVNATGAFVDDVRRMADQAARPIVRPSQGVHVVLDRNFLPADTALMVPRTPDGRVLFAIPWLGRTLVGTTDTPIPAVTTDPQPQDGEIDFILETAGRYLARPPQRDDVRGVFTGIRPLVDAGASGTTAALARDHTMRVDAPGLLTITGGKWTTYRRMAEQCVDRAAEMAGLARRPCITAEMPVHGSQTVLDANDPLAIYGADAAAIRALATEDPTLAEPLDPALPSTGAEVVWAVRQEMARTVDDVLSRRLRALLLDAAAAHRMTPRVAALMARELGRDVAGERTQAGV